MWIVILGMVAVYAIALALSYDRKRIKYRIVLTAFALQAFIAFFALNVPAGQAAMGALTQGVHLLFEHAEAGISFIFGPLAGESMGFVFFVKVLPVIVFISSLTAVLYHLNVMQWIVLVIGGGLRRIVGVTKVESLCTASNIFLGQTESPLAIRPYLPSLTPSQLFTVMTTGLASVSGTILVGYAALGIELKYLITAAFMAAPGGLLMAKTIFPDEEDTPDDENLLDANIQSDGRRAANVFEAAAEGAGTGLMLAANIGAMLLAFIALISLLNGIIGGVGGWFGFADLTFEQILGVTFAPLMYLLGVPWAEAISAGNLVGQKLILNEFIAYVSLSEIKDTLSPHAQAVITFALCGFANFSSLAIQLGGLGILVPERRAEIAQLGLRAIFAGALANLMSAALASFALLAAA